MCEIQYNNAHEYLINPQIKLHNQQPITWIYIIP